MDFEFDPNKSLSNKVKHGIDFEEAQLLWDDELLVSLNAKEGEELRYLSIGRIGQRFWSAVYAIRGERIRLISVRRSRKQEIDLYENQ